MKEFHDMLRRVTSSPYHDQMLKYVTPLKDCLRINHFWYYRITDEGQYTFIGTHSDWNEYCFANHLTKQFPILRAPSTQNAGIQIMGDTADRDYTNVQKEAWEKFQINFNLNLTQKIDNGIDAFGFATNTNNSLCTSALLSELSLLQHFITEFRKKHTKLFEIAFESQVNISAYFGEDFYKTKENHLVFNQRDFVKKMGWQPINPLTNREKEILTLVCEGYPAPYIAKILYLSSRTVENRIAIIKCKLFCSSKSQLIQKAKALSAIGEISR